MLAFILNEVLSITAQESPTRPTVPHKRVFLNEVLSITAQESSHPNRRCVRVPSSMKS